MHFFPTKALLQSAAALAALGTLAGCATPLPPTITSTEFAAEKIDMVTQSAKPATLSINMPGPTAGTVNYQGRIAAADGANTGVSGALSMDIDFATSGMTGTISEVNYVENGLPDQTLGGTVSLKGSVSGSALSGSGSGTLTGVKSGFKGRSEVNLSLSGQFRDDRSVADLITGTANGSGRGDFDFDIDGGSFYANRLVVVR
ncbi:MAG: hypothetical protein ACJA06_000737 [Halocynthiibacter sp.]|jgi:hypothetical protein